VDGGVDRVIDLGGPVHFREWMGPDRQTFVCLHAVGGSHLHWAGAAPGLARHGRVIAIDLPGFGSTPREGRSARLPDNQRLLSRFLGTATTGNVVLVGHSMGGALAILQAAAEPSSVARLVLSSSCLPAARADSSDAAAFRWFLAHRLRMRGRALLRSRGRLPNVARLVSEGIRGAAADPASIDPAIVQASAELARTAQPHGDTLKAFAEGARSTFSLLSHGAEFRVLLNRITCPVLLVHGSRDRTVPVGFALRAAKDHPSWQLAVLADLGHMAQLESANRWLFAVEAWLRSLPE
jgi:pimeloyl-ACP methyl ester carboxylesterase